MPSKYDPEIRAKAVRLVLDHRANYPSEWAAIKAVSSRLGMNADPQFTVPAPNRLLVADFAYVKLVTGSFVYVAPIK